MSNSYRSHRRRKKKSNAGRLGLAGALTGVVGIAAVAVGIMVMRPDGGGADPAAPPAAASGGQQDEGGGAIPAAGSAPKTGAPLSLTTPEGYGYGLAAVKAGTDGHPLDSSKPSPAGSGYAYADYVLTNNQRRPVLLDFPADLFLPKDRVPASAQERCMPQPGVPSAMCTLPNHSKVIARLNGSRPPVKQDDDTFIPAGASYLVRIATDLPVKDGLADSDVKLYVWETRFTNDRKGIELSFP
ncbi:hypothetical protein [Actinomadura hibisca]|uniref:hypothetical protein n=1 Tax=Actinomadura hibisca TaxID=68565 RepID=UPI00082FBDF7|nr:hypothetical protein [Actinomadura hibisca]